jgi:predicted phosphodiesterase
LVPANHDVDPYSIGPVAPLIEVELLKTTDQKRIAGALADPVQRGLLLGRHHHWMDFANHYRSDPQGLPWWSEVFEIAGRRVHVAGLDSAWMSGGDQDQGRLLLGLFQLNDTVQSPEAEAADLRIAVVHHPWSFLADFDGDEAEVIVQQHCQLLLRGHLHKQRAAYVQTLGTGCLELAAGSAYAGSQWGNAFQWIEMDSEQGRIRVQLHHWHGHAWNLDRNVPGASDGWGEFGLENTNVSNGDGAVDRVGRMDAVLVLPRGALITQGWQDH